MMINIKSVSAHNKITKATAIEEKSFNPELVEFILPLQEIDSNGTIFCAIF